MPEQCHLDAQAEFAWGDLHPGNVMAGPQGPVLLDFQRVRPAGPGERRRLRDLGLLDYSLAQLTVSLGDRVRVLVDDVDRVKAWINFSLVRPEGAPKARPERGGRRPGKEKPKARAKGKPRLSGRPGKKRRR